jgi:hypothetical protein
MANSKTRTAEKAAPQDTGIKRDERGRLLPGSAPINPGGRPKGARDALTKAQSILWDNAEALVRKTVDMALEGDTKALKLCIERIFPAVQAEPTKNGSTYLGIQIIAPPGRPLKLENTTIEGETE